MRPSDLKIYELLQTKHTVNDIAAIMGWKPQSVRRSVHTLMQENMVLKYQDGYIATYRKPEIEIKAHNPFNL